ncbi:class I SAM-dependent methyltransferase [Rivularia sp. UHCC 0363]|uniref:class I SAM-dependent methyltransferase n=1 Tax=Rivularia sp. UHCC 0363 TaxID=3110244 RepID=UPI002B1FBF31|nr:class I SAM-dependent methyltransferase [Rivularia sp. UHCC 0363]MEA5593945.1 class I SAM-dependent methyltransferase [Rivularia sp. UHCC 0363]
MEKDFYLQYASVEDKHWWFVARRQIIEQVILKLNLPKNAQILEAGCGTGGNLQMLSRYGKVSAMELDEIACQLANQRQVIQVKRGSLPDNIPFNSQYDLILILDVIEHLDDDLSALKALYYKLKPGGYLLVTVPAYQFLWSEHDEINHHKRRYRLTGLKQVVKNAGYKIGYGSYFNTVLFPVVAIVRGLAKLPKQNKNQPSSDLVLPSKPVNQIFKWLFASERYLINRLSLPFGVSILLLARKPHI